MGSFDHNTVSIVIEFHARALAKDIKMNNGKENQGQDEEHHDEFTGAYNGHNLLNPGMLRSFPEKVKQI
jgi:hypothetical protein